LEGKVGIVSDQWVSNAVEKVAVQTASTVLLIQSTIVKDAETISVWPVGAQAPDSLVDLARQAAQQSRSIQKKRFSKTSQTEITLIAVPLSNKSKVGDKNRIVGAIAMAMPSRHLAEAPVQTPVSSSTVKPSDGMRAGMLEQAIKDATELNKEQGEQRRQAKTVLKLLALIHRHSKFENSANDFVSELVEVLGAVRVGIGFVKDGHTKLTALSNVASLKNSAVFSRDLALAMDESLDQASTLAFPQAKDGEPRVTLAHERFCMRHEAQNIVTVPILIEEDGHRSLVGAITAEFKVAANLSPQNVALLEQLASVLGPALESKRRGSSSLSNLLSIGMGGRGKALLQRSNRKLILGATALVILLGICFIPIEHRVTATARLEGSTQRMMSAAVDGYIAAVHARPGVRIKKDQALIDLDDRDLQLERRKLEAEYSQVERKYGEALVKEEQAQIAIQQAKLSQIKAQVANIDDQLGRIKLIAPFDGVVLSGDQTQSLGAPVKRGDVLMTVAPLDQYRLVVEVDERDIALIKLQQSGQLVLSALPDKNLALAVSRITPVAIVKDGLNVFEVEAQLTTKDTSIQPGLEGVAKIGTGHRPLISVLTNRLQQWVGLSLWKWKL
jgi:hypothetical protein